MPDLTPNNSPDDRMDNSDNDDTRYELISAYIDNELDEEQTVKLKHLIETDNDYRNRFILEKLTKENLRDHSKRIETPPYVMQNIGKGIDDYIRKAQLKSVSSQEQFLAKQNSIQKSNLRRYLFISSFVFVILVAAVFLLNNYLKNSDISDNDFVAMSRNIFDKIQDGQIKVQYPSSNAKDLADSMNKFLNFKVFVPDVKDAVLVGGVCNEIKGEKFAHIIHRKGNIIIYTLQACKSEMLQNGKEKPILSEQFKELVNKGHNWFPCTKVENKNAIIWYKDNVICSSVAAMDYHDIEGILKDYK